MLSCVIVICAYSDEPMNVTSVPSGPRLVQQLSALLSQYPEIKLAILFGSRATSEQPKHAGSDIDVGLLGAAPLSAQFKMQLIEAVSVQFGCPVDIVDLYEAPEPILGQVFKGKRLFGDKMIYGQLLTRHLLNTADFVPLQQRILKERRERWIKSF